MTVWTTHDPQAVHAAAADILATYLRPPPWHADAACREHPDLNWFPTRGQRPDAAKAVCANCLVRSECAEAGDAEADGIFGGMTPHERRQARLVKSAGHRRPPAA